MKKKILMTCTSSWCIKNLFYTGIVKELSYKSELTVLAGEEQLEIVKEQLKSVNVSVIKLPKTKESKIDSLFRNIYRVTMQKSYGLDSEAKKAISRLPFFIYWLVNTIVNNRLFCDFFYKLSRSHLNRSKSPIRYGKFDCFLSTSPFSINEYYLSRDIDIDKKIAFIPSWDNLCTKGIFYGRYDRVLVWGKAVAKMLSELYPLDYKEYNTRHVGIPQFDIYTQSSESKLVDNKVRLLYATSGPHLYPGEEILVKKLLDYADLNPLIEVVVKLHPNDSLSRFDCCIKDYEAKFWVTNTQSGNILDWKPSKLVNDDLARLLANSDICISMASTMMLDAIAAGVKPISINIESSESNLSSFYEYYHLKQFFSISKTPIVDSFESLVKLLNSDFSIDTHNTREHYFPNIGKSSLAVVDAIVCSNPI
ncbi:hypothetical protein [Vibrio sp. THAF190c]|uniref:hypothetical protein n=1 Tax=Vibrio sp. THAF190c TaxID=2587865 RepID=UPI0012683CCF|nr:hypothetical protein [Vibrio sp. THAF190c]QFT08589.1 hypothetical protein FIV04_01010 [Vibrio sp. THAF190c]